MAVPPFIFFNVVVCFRFFAVASLPAMSALSLLPTAVAHPVP